MFNNKIVISLALLCCLRSIEASTLQKFDRRTDDIQLSDIVSATSSCSINVNGDLGTYQPLLIRPGTSEWFHPSARDGIITLAENEQIELYCTTGFATPSGFTTVMATCSADNKFSFNSVLYDFVNFGCLANPTHSVRKTETQCYNNGSIVEAGFVIPDDRFLKVYESCHNDVIEESYYSYYKFTPANDGFQTGVARPSFITGGFFGGKNVDNLYTRAVQRVTVGEILGSYELAETYIEATSEVFMARGHMAAKADFIFGNEHRATFYFTNAAPQWQKFNGLNWVAVEDGSRILAADRNINLEVYSGTHGNAVLPDINGDQQELWFYVSGTTKQIPVPAIYYKILINKAADSGIVLIGVNNPHLTLEEIKKDYIVCTDVSDQISYISWQKDNIERGYSYACTVNDFVKAVPHVNVSASTLLV